MFSFKKFLTANSGLVVFLVLYLIIRIIFININYTEWGDTFRMIRGADYLSRLSWPWDEKRWPFYSLLLIPGIWLNNPILWGRILSLIISILLLVYSYFYFYKNYSANKKYALFAVMMIATSSVFAYWSIRVMADLVFAFLILVFSYYFVLKERGKSLVNDWVLSIILLFLTMTRLEGLFMLIGVCMYLFFKKLYTRLTPYLLLQILIYFPWTLYAKVLHKGQVSNDYLDEFATFTYDLNRLKYFFVYTLFILVIPVLAALLSHRLWCCIIAEFVYKIKGKISYRKIVKLISPYFPIYIFIALIIIVGFIWTPSLPRIYMPIITFFEFAVVNEIERLKAKLFKRLAIWAFLFLIAFLVLQYNLKLYFLGASKVLFGLIVLSGVFFIALLYLSSKNYLQAKGVLIFSLIVVNILVSVTVIHNQKDIYESVAKVNEYIINNIEPVDDIAFSDETGVSSWYLKHQGSYLPQDKAVDRTTQYAYLKENNVEYLLYTNEFNRGSRFSDPEGDSRYMLILEERIESYDLLEDLMTGLGVESEKTEFVSKLYKIN